MVIKKAVYKTSVVKIDDIIKDDVPEFAFVGRSNVGKSTLLNSLVNNKSLAKASATPGKTKMINYFDINDSFRFVDLPGYGYAKVCKEQLDIWSSLIGQYLDTSQSLQTVFLLLDIRLEPSIQDKQMLKFLIYNNIPFVIIATKADKIAKSKQQNQIKMLASKLKVRAEMIFVYSSQQNIGKDKILGYIEGKL